MIINGNEMEIREGITIIDLLKDLGIDSEKVVVEVNLDIISKDDYADKKLSSSSKVEIIRFVGGG